MSARQRALELVAQKQAIEEQILSQRAILDANESTMSTPLVDEEGFPRADIDIYAVRHARVRIIELRNDLTRIMDQIALALQNGGLNDDAASSSQVKLTNGVQSQSNGDTSLRAFARVDGVAPNSPAAEAGLLRQDRIVQFGHLTAADVTTAGSLQLISTLVGESLGRPLDVVVQRGSQSTTTVLHLTPRNGWGGRGSLGCHITPC